MQHFIPNTALICEGGGMRAAVTGGMVSVLIERGVQFPLITGVSAGTTIAVCYVANNIPRLHRCYVNMADDPDFISTKHFLRGHGYFNSHYIYEEAFFDDDHADHIWEHFCASDTDVALSAFNAAKGEIRYWRKADIPTYGDLCRVCRASSSLPFVMPSTYIDGEPYVDGGLYEGFVLQPAIDAGIERFVVLPTHVRGFRRTPSKNKMLTHTLYRNLPHVIEAMEQRVENYNRQMDLLDRLEAEGRALVLYPDEMPVERSERDRAKLEAAWQLGRNQAERDFDSWLAWMLGE